MKLNPKISIIIPAFNEERLLPSCLKSILETRYPKEQLEIILVDNGSNDRTRSVARSYGAQVLRDDYKKVSGLRNVGVSKATGEIIAFVDADCIVSADWLERATLYFDDPTVVAWGSPPVIPEDATWVQRTWFLVRKRKELIQEVDWLETMNLFVRKERFLAVGGFNESLTTCEDADLCYRLAASGKIFSDSRIEVVHLGEAATLKQFLRKEIWRGTSNFKGVVAHGISWKEIPSLSVPLYFGILVPIMAVASAVSLSFHFLVLTVIAFALPSLAALYRLRGKKLGAGDVSRLLILLQVYFLARTIAVFKRA